MRNLDCDIAVLFAGFLAGNLTEEQQRQLEAWKSAALENQALFEKVCRIENLRELNRMSAQYDRETAWGKMEGHFRVQKTPRLKRWIGWAAILLLPLCAGYFLLQKPALQGVPEPLNVAAVILPGSPKAILTLADGSVVDLKGSESFLLQEKDGTHIAKDSAVLSYKTEEQSDTNQHEPVYNKVEIPRGGEYSLVLSDGTLVYLNAMSSLRYPVSFTGNTREVELCGEAYFQVEKDADRPFIVKTQDVEIQVLGTEFNVSAYREDKSVKTALVEGSVQLTTRQSQEPLILKPSQLAKFCKSSGKTSVKKVDVSMYTAWKDGMFDIRDWHLENIMTYLSRWYDINVFYQNEELKKMKFGCYITRYSRIEPILELLEKTGKIHASLKGNTIVFTNK